jgi:hypothetical protein
MVVSVAANITRITQQTVSGGAFKVIPDVLRGLERWGRRWKLLPVETGMGLAYTLDGRPPMDRAAVPAQEDRTSEVASEGGRARFV